MEERKLKLLTSQRAHIFRDMQILYDLSKQIAQDRGKINNFKSRYSRMEALRQEFVEVNQQVLSLKLTLNPTEEVDFQQLSSFDDLYYAVTDVASRELVQTSIESSPANTESSNNSILQPRLPKLELPKFDSNIENWSTFYDTFVTSVHNNPRIAPVDKFNYLISCLSGPALTIAKGLPLNADNYLPVLNTLIERFQNKRVLATKYLDKIHHFPKISAPTFHEIQHLTNTLYESYSALKALNIENLGDYVLFYLASRALDPDTRQRFETQKKAKIPSFQDLITFLQEYVKTLEDTYYSYSSLHKEFNSPKSVPSKNIKYSSVHSRNVGPKRSFLTSQHTDSTRASLDCKCCGLEHRIQHCPTFQSLDARSRLSLVKDKALCLNCLGLNHTVEKCLSKTNCFVCRARHHTLLHTDLASSVPESCTVTHAGTSRVIRHNNTSIRVLLGTCVVSTIDAFGKPQLVRALIDSGAQDCFITADCAKRLGFQLQRCNVSVAGLGENAVCQVLGKMRCTIQPKDSSEPRFTINPIVLENITTNMPTFDVPTSVREHYKHLILADRDFDKPSRIDMLIGAEIFETIYDGQRVKPGPGLPAALHSVFGWVLTGPLEVPGQRPLEVKSSLLSSTGDLDTIVKRFWEVEEPPRITVRAPEDEECERIYSSLMSREPNGRYVVPLLLKESHAALGDSFKHSASRLVNLEKRLSRSHQLKVDYTTFMQEYETLGHMGPVQPNQSGNYFIPHHCVIRPESTTTKLRVVFDASCSTSNGLSLNDIVHTGPKLQVDIIDIITGFRLHAVVFTCDIAKMYRQFLIRPEDRKWQHILWRSFSTDPLKEYELRTVTYGVSSSPYLALRTLRQLADDHGDQWPLAAQVLRNNTFVDDVTTGASSISEALKLKNDLINLLNCAQLELRKWSSNYPEFLAQLPSEHCQTPKSFSDVTHNQQSLKILGVQWDPTEDYFTYSVSKIKVEYTKRSILSNIARIYDPLGWLTPLILVAKLLLQTLWRLQLSWDEQVPRDVLQDWHQFVSDLSHLHTIKIPRQIIPANATESQLVGFCDGSTKAYGCCVYLRTLTDTHIQAHLLIAKSKVAPLKPLTVNRLELCGAVLLARVLNHMRNLLSDKINITQTFAFTDSSTVLSWLSTEPHKLKTFVSHRVVQITDLISVSNWRHVRTHSNPADYCSRGLSCAQLSGCKQWWSGPEWLATDTAGWPTMFQVISSETLPELKSVSHVSTTGLESKSVIETLTERCSSLTRLQRSLAWCLRFIKQVRYTHKRSQGPLTSLELDDSLKTLIKQVQSTFFEEALHHLKSNKPLNKQLQKLSPFLDSEGILRVGGRLTNATIPVKTKYPYLLPKQCHLSHLIIDHFHLTYLHCGPRTLHSLVQRQFWILGIRNLIRSRLSKCVTCFKVKPIPCQPVMGNLPKSRLVPGQCFRSVGIDFGGPFAIKESRRRAARTYKAYICLIICLTVKAVHLELVSELTTEAFIAALDRFVSRRGLCQTIITDCGTNFVGAKRYLSDINKMLVTNRESISDQLTSRSITWSLNPPSAPHFGGIFESGIKSTKYHLRRVIGSQILTFEEFVTILTKTEAMLNSRPLCDLSADPAEVDVLTAGHFLIGRPLVSLPEPIMEDNIPIRTRWQLLQRLSQSFWLSWQRDYLRTLQQKAKWYRDGKQVPAVGDLVTIMETHLAPNEWRLGRVLQVHPGKDNAIRVVTLKTATGVLTRPVVKVCPLPITFN